LKNVRQRGEQIRAGFEELKSRFGFVREIRGEGLMLGLELSVEGAPFVAEALDHGLVINCTHDFTLRFLPPFIIGKRQVREFLLKLETVFKRLGAAKQTPRPLAPKANSRRLAF
jgi:acetylornithine/N-succinyldiaminopimelate aminotransferase